MSALFFFEIMNINDFLLAALAVMILGISKSGVHSISVVTVTMLAYVFGSKSSTGILLPMMIAADIVAVWHYRSDVQWGHLKRLLPWIVIGIVFGAWFGKDVEEVVFKKVMAGIILFSVVLLFWFEAKTAKKVPTHWTFASTMGLGAGFTTMVGNLAGGLSNVYFLSMRLMKNEFIGTAAWLYFIVNIIKLPFHIFWWKTVRTDSLLINLMLLPFMLLGFFIGLRIVRTMGEGKYRQMILWLTAVSTLFTLSRL